MAKISARGAKEIARIKAISPAGDGYTYSFVLTSDGRVLRKGDLDSGYTIVHRVKFETNLNEAFLRRFAMLRGLTVQ